MYSDAGDKEPALEVLKTIETEKKAGDPSLAALPIEKVYYYRGNLLFWYRDYEEAIANLKRVTPNTSVLDPHTAVMAWMRLGQCYDVKGDRKSAQTAYREADNLGPETEPEGVQVLSELRLSSSGERVVLSSRAERSL